MALSKSLAQILLRLSEGEKIPASKLKNQVIGELLSEGIVVDIRSGRTKSLMHVPKAESLHAFLLNRYSITDLKFYLDTLGKENLTRADLIQAASDSKVKKVRTFTGFLVNSFKSIEAKLNGDVISIHPTIGTFLFIYDLSNFQPGSDVTIVGIENPENFKQIVKQRHLFASINPLFVCRYPQGQSKDFIKWLMTIPNPYLHFGDFDFAGIGIYLNEYKCHLGSRSMFYIPDGIDTLIKKWGNVNLYNSQKINYDLTSINEPLIHNLLEIIHKYKKGLEQEILINTHEDD